MAATHDGTSEGTCRAVVIRLDGDVGDVTGRHTQDLCQRCCVNRRRVPVRTRVQHHAQRNAARVRAVAHATRVHVAADTALPRRRQRAGAALTEHVHHHAAAATHATRVHWRRRVAAPSSRVHRRTRLTAPTRHTVHRTRRAAHAVHVHNTATRLIRRRQYDCGTAGGTRPPRPTHAHTARATHERARGGTDVGAVGVGGAGTRREHTHLDVSGLTSAGDAAGGRSGQACAAVHALHASTATARPTRVRQPVRVHGAAGAPRRRRPQRDGRGTREPVTRSHRARWPHVPVVAQAGVDVG